MKKHKNLYEKLYSTENLTDAYKKARKGKSKKKSVVEFEKNINSEMQKLQKELKDFSYSPKPLKKFIIRDPKTRTIHASAFRDRIVHHALVNLLKPIFEKIFIYDSYASKINKGAHIAVKRFDQFKRKVSLNGKLVRGGGRSNSNIVQGYCLKADIKHYFDTIDHEILIKILKRKIEDKNIIWLTRKILRNFNMKIEGKGMPLGNYTSQFLANVYLNDLDYFVKHKLKARYYIRYVDDFVILHRSEKRLEYFKKEIDKFLRIIKLELHPDKSKIIPLQKGINFLGYRIFYYYKLLRKKNIRHFLRKFNKKLNLLKEKIISKEDLEKELEGWFGYAQWANTYKLRKDLKKKINT